MEKGKTLYENHTHALYCRMMSSSNEMCIAILVSFIELISAATQWLLAFLDQEMAGLEAGLASAGE